MTNIILKSNCLHHCSLQQWRISFYVVNHLWVNTFYLFKICIFIHQFQFCGWRVLPSNWLFCSWHITHMTHKNQLHIPLVSLSAIQRGMTYSAIKVFSKLPPSISRLKIISNFLICFKQLSSYTCFLFYRRIYIKLLVPFLLSTF
jgi:hypothetical protein